MSNHTPGPWSVMLQNSRPDSRNFWSVPVQVGERENAGNVICIVGKGGAGATGVGQEDVEANAHLIAAAPDLVEALQFAKSVIKSGEPWTPACQDVIDTALAKARGEATAS